MFLKSICSTGQFRYSPEADFLQRHIEELVCTYVCKTLQEMFTYKNKYLFGYSFNETTRTVGRSLAVDVCDKFHLNKILNPFPSLAELHILSSLAESA